MFYFTILYNDKSSFYDFVEQSEYVVVAACRGLKKICLKEVNGKDFLFITDDISDCTNYPEEIDYFLSRQCSYGSKVTAEMLYHAIFDSTNELFPKMRLTDIYYNYKYLSETKTTSPKIDIYTSAFDKYINDIFPCSKEVAIEKMMLKLGVLKRDAIMLFERWKQFFFIDYHPYEEWIPNSPKETLTIEQFKDRLFATRIDVKKDESTGELYFEAGKVKGIVSTKEIPKHPMISLFITSNSNEHWILHEEGSMVCAPKLENF